MHIKLKINKNSNNRQKYWIRNNNFIFHHKIIQFNFNH